MQSLEIAILHPEKSINYSCLQSSLKIKPYVLAILLKEGKKNPLKKELAVYAPATMMSYGEGVKLQWPFDARGKVTLKHTATMKTTLSKVAWQIILSPTKRITNLYRYPQLQAITHLH